MPADASFLAMLSPFKLASLCVYALIVWAILSLALSTSRPPVRFLFAPHVVTDQQTVVIEVWVDRDPRNRHLLVAACDEDFCVRRSDVQLDGEYAAQVFRVQWQPLPAGELLLLAATSDHRRELARAVQPLLVVGAGR